MNVERPFARSCRQFQDYPKNLLQHHVLYHSVQAFNKRLSDDRYRLFDEQKAAVNFLDLNETSHYYQSSCVSSFREIANHLRESFPEHRDPQCRFVFLHAPHSRAPLRISFDMFNILFTYHQVMAPFLDFVFPFGKQLYPQDFHFSGFREESRFTSVGNEQRIPELGRSGLGLRLCYNLRSVERSADVTDLPWSIRQTAVYHEFDTETGRAVWIIVKGNKLIRNRMKEASASPDSASKSSRSSGFSASLAAHLLLCDWSGENWRWYLNDLEDQLQVLTRDVLAARVDNQLGPVTSPETSVTFSSSPLSRSSTFPMLSRATTNQFRSISRAATSKFSFRSDNGTFQSKLSSRSPTLVFDPQTIHSPDDANSEYVQHASGEIVHNSYANEELASASQEKTKPHALATRSWWKSMNQPQDTTSVEIDNTCLPHNSKLTGGDLPLSNKQKKMKIKKESHSFNDLQKIQFIQEKAEEALLVLKSNAEVLGELRQHYIYASGHAEYPEELKTECQADLSRFERCISGVEKDLRMLQARTETLLSLLANRKSLLYSILQHHGVKQAQTSADQMERMTREMHEIAKKTKQETVSMRVITSVTLFFLPATFIATFMSTDILKFGHGESDFQIQGLKVYLAIALPLTILTFVAWYMIYLCARRRDLSSVQKQQHSDAEKMA
ncbi:hypothetical protein BKA66DRAFT_250388 [Pyrenochaeta sp. MPI-SDFR-AT-0127]|nr:hypothetical protein BKA66DRAFT_250388 [Pyrenochaeta sp. MPI-SDFR-AT-0127]